MICTNWKDLDAPKIDLKEGKDSTTIGDALTVIKNSYSDFIKEISYEGYIDSTAILKTSIILSSGQGGKIIIKPYENFINYDILKLFREDSSTGGLISAYFEKQNDGTFIIFPSGGGQGSVDVKFYFTHIGLANNILNTITYRDNGINLNHDPFYLQKQNGQLYNNIKKSKVEQSNWTQNEQLQWYKNQLMKDPQSLTLYGFQQHTYDGYQINSQPISLLIPYKNLTNEPLNKENGKPSQGFGTQNGGVYKYFNHYGGIFPDFINNISNKGNSTYGIIFQDDKITIGNKDYYFNPNTDLLLCFAQTVGDWTCTQGVWEGEEGKENSIFIKQDDDYSTQSNIYIQGKLSFKTPIVTVINSNININNHSLGIFSWNNLNQSQFFNLQTENNILLNPTILPNSSSNKIEKIRNFEWVANSQSVTDKFGAFNLAKASASINSPRFSLSINFLDWIEDFFDLQHIISFENNENHSQCSVEGHQNLQNYSIKYGFHFYNTVQPSYDGVFPQSINLVPLDLYWEVKEGQDGAAYAWQNTYKWYSYTESKNVTIKNTAWPYHYYYYANFWYSSSGMPSDTNRNTYTDAITTFDTLTDYFYLKPVIYHNLLTYSNLEQVKSVKILLGGNSQGAKYKFNFTLTENQKAILSSKEYHYVGYFYSPNFNSIGAIDGINWDSANQTLSITTHNSSGNAELEYHFYYWKKNLEL